MGKKVAVIPVVNPEIAAREQFAGAVQGVAFQLTLSRRMIDCLQLVRDYGFPHLGGRATDTNWKVMGDAPVATWTLHNDELRFYALQRRGLVYFDPTPSSKRKTGQRTVLLSCAGQLTCALLVEAGLMSDRGIRLSPAKVGRA
jgi:hypothetical protein